MPQSNMMQSNLLQPNIIQEDNDIIICHKPAGIATQTGRLGQKDMESLLRNYRAGKGEDTYIGIVHRLDQPVEGVMVFAKNKKAAAALSAQVQNHKMGKHYLAVAHLPAEESDSMMLPQQGTLTDYLVFDQRSNRTTVLSEKEAAHPQGGQKPQKAVLDYEIRKRRDDMALFDIALHTGRHHQIRVQLANMGCPIVGDRKYGGADDTVQEKQLALCAYRLVFFHPSTGEKKDVSIIPQNPAFRLFF